MKVLLINKLYAPWIGGVEKYVQDLAEGLMKQGIEAEVLAAQEPQGKSGTFEINGIKVHKVFSFGNLWGMPLAPFFFWHMRKLAKQFDVLHFQYPFPIATLSYFLAGIPYDKKIILTFHSEIVRQKKLKKFIDVWEKPFLRRCSTIIVTSPTLLENSEILKGIKEKCNVIPLGIDVERFKRPTVMMIDLASSLREKYGRPLILFVGRLSYYKGITYLVEAIKYIKKGNLLIVGNGPLLKELKKSVNRYRLGLRIFFERRVDDIALPAYFHACDVFVLPSIEISEAFGYVQLEAMAAGKPVISSNLPTGVSYVNQNGKTGFLVPPRDAGALAETLDRIFGDERLYRKLSQNAQQRAEDFSLKGMVDDTIAVYKNLLQGQ